MDLASLFAAEVDERGARLSEGARLLLQGPLDPEMVQTMVREGHTIKGTARMMGYTAVSDAGKLIEDGWRGLRDGEVEPSANFANALASLTQELRGAIEADPATGTPGLAAGMRALRVALHQPHLVVALTATPEVAEDPSDGDLDGLLRTIGSFGGDHVRVDAANLYRLINELCSLRVDAELLAGTLAVSEERGDVAGTADIHKLVDGVNATVADLQQRAVELAAMPLSDITATFAQLVRYIARRSDKDIRLELTGVDVVADRQVVERLSDPVRHLLVNAVEHGIEPTAERQRLGKPPTGLLSLHAEVTGQRLVITVEDDGRGVDWEAVRRIALQRGLVDAANAHDRDALRTALFARGLSTVTEGDLIGEGMGLALVAEAVESLQGTVTFESEPGKGTRVVITAPRSRALQDAVIVHAAGQRWGIPEISVLDSIPYIGSGAGFAMPEARWAGEKVPVAVFAEALGLRPVAASRQLLIVSTTSGPFGFVVEAEEGRRQVAARELGPVLSGVRHLTGAALLGGGEVIVLVDPTRLAERARSAERTTGPRRRVLVVDDSRGARQVVGGALGSAGFEVDLAGSPTEALSVLADSTFDAIVLDYMMPTMDGATLAARIRALGIAAPIVMLSGVATEADAARALEAGADSYLDKDDVRKGALAAEIGRLIEPNS